MRILIIDDEPSVLSAFKRLISTLGDYAVTTALGGAVGLAEFDAALANGCPFDAILSDVSMPLLDGREVYRHVAGRGHADRLVFMSGAWPSDFAAELDAAGVKRLDKPTDSALLARALVR